MKNSTRAVQDLNLKKFTQNDNDEDKVLKIEKFFLHIFEKLCIHMTILSKSPFTRIAKIAKNTVLCARPVVGGEKKHYTPVHLSID